MSTGLEATPDQPHILVVDDDRRLRQLLKKYLSENGFRVTTASDALDARRMMDNMVFDMLVLDVMMPGESGLALTESVRRESQVPILLLTAMGEAEDRIGGLQRGADDYLTKPFEPRELVLRLEGILRRTRRGDQPGILLIGDCTFDRKRGELRRDDVIVRLTTAEEKLLSTFAAQPGVTLQREELIRQSGIEANNRTVDVQITRLRRKIEPDPRQPRYLQTVRGEGYVLYPD